eukprot:2415430-Rhodomonas_salina.1
MEHCLMSLATALQLVVDVNGGLVNLCRIYPALRGLSNYLATDPNLAEWRREMDIVVPEYLDCITEYIQSLEQ